MMYMRVGGVSKEEKLGEGVIHVTVGKCKKVGGNGCG